MSAASRGRPGPAADRLLVARLSGIAQRHARWGAMDEAQKAEGEAALREVAGDRPDLLAQVAGIMLGTAEGKGPEYQARGQAVAELCRLAGADQEVIASWIEVGRERRADTRHPPPPPGTLRGKSRS